MRCSGTYVDKDGQYVTKQPEYETVWAHGPNCGIDDLDAIATLDRLDDDFGSPSPPDSPASQTITGGAARGSPCALGLGHSHRPY
ncbi:MAG: aldehyde ferredoxin oxidoreductase C-terminal domain-containing protein [Desulfobacterales bacterium]